MFVENLVIGSSYESYLYSFLKGYHHLSNGALGPLFYETARVGFFGEKNKKAALTHIKILLSIAGRSFDFLGLEKIKIEDSMLRVYSDYPTVKYSFGCCYIFDKQNVVHENEIVGKPEITYKVVDDFEVRNLPRSQKTIPAFSEGFLKAVNFYTSDRVLGAKHITDCVAESVLSREQISSLEYSDTVAKFLIQNKLKSLGYLGRISGKRDNGKHKYLSPEVTHVNRYVHSLDHSTYRNTESVFFLNLSEHEILNSYV